MMPLANMRSTIVIFIIVFAILGVLLGFAEAYDTKPTIRLLTGTQNSIQLTNNSDESCPEDSVDCVLVYQNP